MISGVPLDERQIRSDSLELRLRLLSIEVEATSGRRVAQGLITGRSDHWRQHVRLAELDVTTSHHGSRRVNCLPVS